MEETKTPEEETTEEQEERAVQQGYHLIASAVEYFKKSTKSCELRLHTDDIENIHYQIIDTSNDPPDFDFTYKKQSDAFSEWKTIVKTIRSKEVNKECEELKKNCNKIIAAAKNKQGSLFNPDEEEESAGAEVESADDTECDDEE